jgi:hypothetical protein
MRELKSVRSPKMVFRKENLENEKCRKCYIAVRNSELKFEIFGKTRMEKEGKKRRYILK